MDQIRCIYCGFFYSDSWEYDDEEECIEVKCGACGKKFNVTISKQVHYSSYCIEHEFVEDPTEIHPDKMTCIRCGELQFSRFLKTNNL